MVGMTSGEGFSTLCPKKIDTPLACYNFDVHQLILIIFGRNFTETAGSQTMIYFPTCLSNASALPGKTLKHENCIFPLRCCITALPEFNQSLPDVFNFVDLQFIFTLL